MSPSVIPRYMPPDVMTADIWIVSKLVYLFVRDAPCQEQALYRTIDPAAIAAAIGQSERHVRRALDELCGRFFLRKVKSGVYQVITSDEIDRDPPPEILDTRVQKVTPVSVSAESPPEISDTRVQKMTPVSVSADPPPEISDTRVQKMTPVSVSAEPPPEVSDTRVQKLTPVSVSAEPPPEVSDTCVQKLTPVSKFGHLCPFRPPKEYNINIINNKIKEKKERDFFSLKDLFAGTEPGGEFHEPYAAVRAWAAKKFAEEELSPDLVDRIAAARVKRIPGFDEETLSRVYARATDEWIRRRENNRLANVKTTVFRKWYWFGSYVSKTLESAGYDLPAVRPWHVCLARRNASDEARRRREEKSLFDLSGVPEPDPVVEPAGSPPPDVAARPAAEPVPWLKAVVARLDAKDWKPRDKIVQKKPP